MHVLLLSSIWPILGHKSAGKTVLGHLCKTLLEKGHDVSLAVCCPVDLPEEESFDQLMSLGLKVVGDFTNEMNLDNPDLSLSFFKRILSYSGDVFAPLHKKDYPLFSNPEETAEKLQGIGADCAILFWDSWFERLLPYLSEIPTIGYLAKPRMEAGYTRAVQSPTSVRRWLNVVQFKGQQKRHLEMVKHLDKAVNICALDADFYSNNDVPCDYVPNTWPDAFGADVYQKRIAAEGARDSVQILGNIGAISATGNSHGIMYISRYIVPLLQEELSGLEWEVNICGGGTARSDIAPYLKNPKISVRGFVDDIDNEILSNVVFLLCNNAGPYTGGYTRVIYVMSSAGCLVAHNNLAKSMPELVHGENCLLGETPEEISELIVQAVKDNKLRFEIGNSARKTYNDFYHPSRIVEKLLSLS